MRWRFVAMLTLALFSVSCAQAVTTRQLAGIKDIAKETYSAYFYYAGQAGFYRAVLLIKPESGIEVVPYSENMTAGSSNPVDAMAFMDERRSGREIDVREVRLNDAPVGYLFQYVSRSVRRASFDDMETSVFERGGKLYFSVVEKPIVN